MTTPTTTPAIVDAPGGLPLLGHALQMRNNPLGFFRSLPAHGDIVRIRIGPQSAYVLNTAALGREMLVAKPRQFKKGVILERATDMLGNGLTNSEGDVHKQHRRLMQPAFHRHRIADYTTIMTEQIVEHIDGWHDGQSIEVRPDMTALVLDIAARTLISSDVGADLLAEMQHLPRMFELLYKRATTPFAMLNSLPLLPRNRAWTTGLARLHPLIDKVIADYRDSGERGNDLMSMLLEARDDETGKMFSDQNLHDQVMVILVAGSETTAATLSWVFHLLTEYPEMEQRLHAEVDEVLDGRPAQYTDAPRLTYTAQVISETLRQYPPVWMLARNAAENVELGGQLFAKGTSIFLSPYVLQRDPAVFDDPEKFDPDRWSPERAGKIPRDAMIQFGAGPRKCIGDVFAVVEATLALATIAARWRLCAEPGAPAVEKVAAATLNPRNLFLTTQRRR